MGKRDVLGNDPFERGAAARDAVVDASPQPKAPARHRRVSEGAKKPSIRAPKGGPGAPQRRTAPRVEGSASKTRDPREPDRARVEPPSGEAMPRPSPSPIADLALKIAGRALASPVVQRAVQTLGASPAVGRAISVAARATGFVWRSPVGGAARALLPAARKVTDAALSPDAASGLVATALSAAEAAHRIVTTRSDPSDVDEFGEDPSVVDRLNPVLDFLYERYWRVEAQGVEHVPEGPCIIVCNHSGALPFDGPMVRTFLRRAANRPEARWLVEDAIAHAPFMGVYLNRLGAVRACPENAERLLDKKVPLIVFPEGVHGMGKITVGWAGGERYKVGRFGRGGFVKLALRKGVPIVPLAIVGAEDALPLLAKIPAKGLGVPYIPVTPTLLFPLPTRWSMRVLPPIHVDGDRPPAENEQVRIQQLTEDVRQRVQAALDDLSSRRSA